MAESQSVETRVLAYSYWPAVGRYRLWSWSTLEGEWVALGVYTQWYTFRASLRKHTLRRTVPAMMIALPDEFDPTMQMVVELLPAKAALAGESDDA